MKQLRSRPAVFKVMLVVALIGMIPGCATQSRRGETESGLGDRALVQPEVRPHANRLVYGRIDVSLPRNWSFRSLSRRGFILGFLDAGAGIYGSCEYASFNAEIDREKLALLCMEVSSGY
ncbi:MAG TPA: hypothetical protein VMX75_13315 [Spirochaetia bacterium]|nr:hypothetical protein [Spirochaetia bacterium]